MIENVFICNIQYHDRPEYNKLELIKSIALHSDANLHTYSFKNTNEKIIKSFEEFGVKVHSIDKITDNFTISLEEEIEISSMFYYDKEVANIINVVSEHHYHLCLHAIEKNLEKIFENSKINKVIVWGNGTIPKIAVKVAKKKQIKFLILEEGYFRKFGIQCSKYGTNFQGEILSEYNLRKQKYIFKNKEVRKITEKYSTYSNPSLDEEKIMKEKEFKNYILVPLQMNSDTQIILNSPIFRNMYEYVEFLINEITIYNIKNNTNYKLVFKFHPLHAQQGNWDDFKKIKTSFSNSALFVRDIDLNFLLDKIDIIFTINSTVGFEALNRYKKVMVFGNAIYSSNDIATITNNRKDFSDNFTKLLKTKIAKKEIDNYIEFVVRKHLKINLLNPSKKEIISLFKRFN